MLHRTNCACSAVQSSTYTTESVTVDQLPVYFIFMAQLRTPTVLLLELHSHLERERKRWVIDEDNGGGKKR